MKRAHEWTDAVAASMSDRPVAKRSLRQLASDPVSDAPLRGVGG